MVNIYLLIVESLVELFLQLMFLGEAQQISLGELLLLLLPLLLKTLNEEELIPEVFLPLALVV